MNKPATILVVDDSEANREVLEELILLLGHEPLLAEDGLMALEQLQLHDVDLVLLDIMMPKMDGYQVLERIKSNHDWQNLPVIMISGLDDVESVVRCIEKGADDYLGKPFNLMLLKARIASSLAKKQLLDMERRRTKDQLKLAEKIFECAIEGVFITDTTPNILMVNPAFTKITGYNPEDVMGQNPKILRSNRHDRDYYQTMWTALLGEGRWQGEIWNRRKSGQAYPGWLSITSLENESGKTTRYIALLHDISDLKQREERIRFQANHDALTGLPNRELFRDRLKQTLVLAQRNNQKLGVLTIGLDHFAKINASLGHEVGDQVLKEIARRFARLLKGRDTVCRYAGDEFIILITDITREEIAAKVAQRMVDAMMKRTVLENREIYISVSVGAAVFPNDAVNADELIKNAGIAMKRAKSTGRNNCQMFAPTMNARAMERLGLENELRKGVENEQFLVYYQPKVDISAGKIVGAEALVRWLHPEKGLISPGLFIPIAEETAIILDIGEFVLRRACADIKEWLEQGYPPICVSVNLSSIQFQRQDILSLVKTVLQETGLPPTYLELEITESIIMNDVEKAIRIMREFNQMGISISIDDFGTGYSSLNYLKQFPINTLKIDQSFMRDIPEDNHNTAITTAIISLAKSLNLKVIAEGVETDRQLAFLQEQKCDEIQGYWFSPPIPKADFSKRLKETNIIADEVENMSEK